MKTHLTTFERAALASGLLTQEQLDKGWSALMQANPARAGDSALSSEERLANRLVEMGILNLWQSKQLLAGNTKFKLGPYWIVDSIGYGGMGQVFKAQHVVLDRVVAIKVLPRNKSTPEAIANFTREIRAQAKLDHPNLVRALDAGHDGNVYYLVTEYVPGTDLRKLVRARGPLSMEAAASIISQAAAGLQHAHEQGLIHRDVKPGNVLVAPDGHAKLSDLGLAGPLGGDAENDPRFGRIVGTADYLSPDHIQSPWKPTPAWDIYSLGCTLYYAVSGKVPFPGGSTVDKANAHCKLRPLDPSRLNRNLNRAFIDVLAEMMAKDPAERIQSASQVVARLAPWVNSTRAVAASAPGRSSGSNRPTPPPDPSEEVEQEDTATSFPELPELAPNQKDSPSQISQITHPVAAATEETHSPLDLRDESPDAVPMWWPLAVLVGFPLSLVGLILLIWWATLLL